jgi:hypothetical protein
LVFNTNLINISAISWRVIVCFVDNGGMVDHHYLHNIAEILLKVVLSTKNQSTNH